MFDPAKVGAWSKVSRNAKDAVLARLMSMEKDFQFEVANQTRNPDGSPKTTFEELAAIQSAIVHLSNG